MQPKTKEALPAGSTVITAIQIFGATRETFSPRVSRVAPQTRIIAQVTPFEQANTPLNGMTREVN